MIEFRDVSKTYENGTHALNHVNIKINKGEFVFVVGASGAGKSTFLKLMMREEVPSHGKVIIKNQDLSTLTRSEIPYFRRGLGIVFQDFRLIPKMTVFDNVLIAKHLRRSSNMFTAMFRLNAREEARQRAEVLELLRVVGLEDVKDELATSLPYGKQRRLEIARALATDPKLLLLDEPAAGMNPQETLELAEFIREIREKFHKTILLIEHHMDLVMGIADRIYVLDFGELIAQGTPEEIQNNARVIDAYLGVADDAED